MLETNRFIRKGNVQFFSPKIRVFLDASELEDWEMARSFMRIQ